MDVEQPAEPRRGVEQVPDELELESAQGVTGLGVPPRQDSRWPWTTSLRMSFAFRGLSGLRIWELSFGSSPSPGSPQVADGSPNMELDKFTGRWRTSGAIYPN